jgi:hypothetical protein
LHFGGILGTRIRRDFSREGLDLIELFTDLGPTTLLGLGALLILLVIVVGSILNDFRIAKDPQRRLDFVPKEFENLSLMEKHRMADWRYRYSNPKAILGLLLASLVFYLLK